MLFRSALPRSHSAAGCLDHMIVLSEEHCAVRWARTFLIITVRGFTSRWIEIPRNHAPYNPIGRIVAFPEVGGLHHRYDRVA
jgi:hypothetical protein